jgi:hypothetical protein
MPGMMREFSIFLPKKDVELLRASEKLGYYADAILELEKEFPTSQEAPKEGEIEIKYLKWVEFGT